MKRPEISICIPVYPAMKNGEYFLKRCLQSIKQQSFKNYEIVMTHEGSICENTNNAIKKARGKLIKILNQDDYFTHKDSLKYIVKAFDADTRYAHRWLVTGCNHDDGKEVGNIHLPTYSYVIAKGVNTIGSPSVLTMRQKDALYFDEELTWVLDCELYLRLFASYGLPKILNDINVTIGIGDHQATNHISSQRKSSEVIALSQR